MKVLPRIADGEIYSLENHYSFLFQIQNPGAQGSAEESRKRHCSGNWVEAVGGPANIKYRLGKSKAELIYFVCFGDLSDSC